jgi:hypothetical protein
MYFRHWLGRFSPESAFQSDLSSLQGLCMKNAGVRKQAGFRMLALTFVVAVAVIIMAFEGKRGARSRAPHGSAFADADVCHDRRAVLQAAQ